MKSRFIKPNTKYRIMIRMRCCEDCVGLRKHARDLGYTEVGLVKFIGHMLFWWKKPKPIKKA